MWPWHVKMATQNLLLLFGYACHSLTNSLTHSCLVNLIDVTLACEDGNSKLVEVVTVVDVDDEKCVGNSLLQIWKLKLKKVNFCSEFEHKLLAQALKLNALGLMCLWEWFLILDLKVLFPLEGSFTTPTTHGLSWTCVFESFICKPWIILAPLETSQYSFLLETIACCLWWH